MADRPDATITHQPAAPSDPGAAHPVMHLAAGGSPGPDDLRPLLHRPLRFIATVLAALYS